MQYKGIQLSIKQQKYVLIFFANTLYSGQYSIKLFSIEYPVFIISLAIKLLTHPLQTTDQQRFTLLKSRQKKNESTISIIRGDRLLIVKYSYSSI